MIYVKPKGEPEALLKAIVGHMMHGSERRVPGWAVMNELGELTLADPAFSKKAFLLPRVEQGHILFHLRWPEGAKPDAEVYAAFHARFVEVLLRYFHDRVELASCS